MVVYSFETLFFPSVKTFSLSLFSYLNSLKLFHSAGHIEFIYLSLAIKVLCKFPLSKQHFFIPPFPFLVLRCCARHCFMHKALPSWCPQAILRSIINNGLVQFCSWSLIGQISGLIVHSFISSYATKSDQ